MTKKEEKTSLDQFKESRLPVFARVMSYTVTTMIVLAGAGYYLDHYLGTFPKIFITTLVVSYPLIQFVIYKKIKSFTKNKLDSDK